MSTQELKKAGLSATLPRIKILEVFEQGPQTHYSAEDIYKILLGKGENIGVATIYRVLNQFSTAGIIQRLNLENGHAIYELDTGQHHDHFYCVKCAQIEEFYDDTIEQRQQIIATKAGWTITEHSMVLFGLCPECSKR